MKKRILSALLGASLLISSHTALGAEFKKIEDKHAVPASVYQEPFMDSRFTTQYAPWYKIWHPMSQSEYERGESGADAHQQIRALAISPVDSDIMYFGTDTSGIWKTQNGGESWYNTNNGYRADGIYDILCDPVDRDTVYVSGQNNGFARSTDGGKTWVEILSDSDDVSAYKSGTMEIDSAGNLYMAAFSGIYKLDKAKQTVVNMTPQFASLNATDGMDFRHIDVSDDGMHIYVAAKTNSKNLETAISGLYTSHDGGKTWTNSGLSDAECFNTQSVVIYPDNPLDVYAAGAFVEKESGKTVSGKEQQLWHSIDGGKTWEKVYQNIYENLEEGISASATAIMQLEFGPKNKNGIYDLYYMADQTTFPFRVSHDYGKTFERIFKPEDRLMDDTFYYKKGTKSLSTGFYYNAYALDMNRAGHLFFGFDGIWEYDNDTFTRKSVGFSGCALTDIAINSKGEAFFSVVDSRGAYTQTGSIYDTENYPTMIIGEYDGGWSGTDSFVHAVFDPNDDNHVLAYVGASNSSPKVHGIRHSWDRGQSFESMAESAQMTNRTQGNSKFIKYDPEDSNTIYTSYITSHDNGKTWEPNDYAVIAMSNDCKRWFGTKGSGSDTEYYYSVDKGKTWEFILKPGTGSMQDVFLDEGGDYVWLTRSWGLYKIDLGAKKIINCNELLNCNSYNLIQQNPENPKHIIVTGMGTDSNMMFLSETNDGGKTWHRVPGPYIGYTTSLTFLNGKMYCSGMSGTHIYDYKKYWEFLASKITVILDSKEISFTIMPEIVEGRTMVPMRELFELLGATVNWDSDTRTVAANKERSSVKLQIDNTAVNMNGIEKQMEAAPYIKNGRTMVPLRFASVALGIRVGWDDETNTIYMKSE